MGPGDKMTLDELNSLLNSWQEGSVGHAVDRETIAAMDRLGAKIGYGWLHQLAGFLYEIQCHGSPDRAAYLKRSRFNSMGWKLPEDFEVVAEK